MSLRQSLKSKVTVAKEEELLEMAKGPGHVHQISKDEVAAISFTSENERTSFQSHRSTPLSRILQYNATSPCGITGHLNCGKSELRCAKSEIYPRF